MTKNWGHEKLVHQYYNIILLFFHFFTFFPDIDDDPLTDDEQEEPIQSDEISSTSTVSLNISKNI